MRASLVFLLSMFMAGMARSATVDEVELALRGAYAWPLRWDNVESRPRWLSGAEPRYDAGWRMHRLELAPGAESVVRLPAASALRLLARERALTQEDVEVLIEGGSGLALQIPLLADADGTSLLAIPRTSEPWLAHIRRPAGAHGRLALAAFVSRREIPDDLAPYRNLVELPGLGVLLRRGGHAEARRHWEIEAHRPVYVELDGPARYAVASRLRHESGEHGLVQDWRLSVRVDGGGPQWLEYAGSAETAYPVYANERAQAVSREETAFLEIPAGHHRVAFEADRGLYLRLLEQEHPDYLLPRLNQPRLSAERARERLGIPGQAGISFWQGHGTPVPHSHAARGNEEMIERAVHDNARRGGPLAAVQTLQRTADLHPEYPALRHAAEETRGLRSFYRELLPAAKAGSGQFRAHFLTPQLREPGEKPGLPTVMETHLDEWLARLPGGVFTWLAPRRTQTYRLPPRLADGWLELAVARPGQAGRRGLWLRLDGQAQRRLELGPPPAELDADDWSPRPSHAALHLFAERHRLPDAPTLSGAFAARAETAPLIDAGHVELPLPRGVQRIEIGQDGGAPLAVSVRYRADRTFELGEAAYRNALARTARPLDWFFQLLHEPQRAAADVYREDLRSDWLPLMRLLRAEAALYQAGVAPPPIFSATDEPAPATAQTAGEAERRGDLLSALEQWGLQARQGGVHGEAARLHQARLLRAMGESYLAERLWRQIALYGQAPEHRAEAVARLEAWYRERDELSGLRQLRAALLLAEPTPERLARVAESLADTAQPGHAVRLGWLLEDAKNVAMDRDGLGWLLEDAKNVAMDRDALLRAALREGWSGLAGHWLAALPEPDRKLWQGWLAQRDGALERAQEYWRGAGKEARPWLAALRRGLDLDESARAAWWREHPGPRQWQDAGHWVWQYPGAVSYYSLERDVYGTALRAEPDAPLHLHVTGPLRLRLRVRPLHPAASGAALDDWLHVRDGQGLRVFPLSNNQPAEGLLIPEDAGLRPGQEVAAVYEVGAGLHEISLYAERAALGVQVDEWAPELPLALVPPPRPRVSAPPADGADATRFLGLGVQMRPDEEGRWSAITVPLHETRRSDMYSCPTELSHATRPSILAEILAARDYPALFQLPPAGAEDAAERIDAFVYVLEHDSSLAQTAFAGAETLWRRHGGQPAVNDAWQRAQRHGTWAPVGDIAASRGIRKLALSGWQPADPYLRIRRALMEETGADELILADARPLVVALASVEPTTLNLSLRPLDPPFLSHPPVSVAYRVDDQPERRLVLEPGADWRELRLPVPAGEHSLHLALADAPANLFLRIRATERGVNLIEPAEQYYHVLGPGQPLEVYAQGPAWMRLDRRNGAGLRNEYRPLAPEWQSLRVDALGAEEELVRAQIHRVEPRLRPIANRDSRRELASVPPTPLAAGLNDAAAPVPRLRDDFALGRQEDGTWSLGIAAVRRNNLQEDQSRPQPEQFLEYQATHRYRSEEDGFLYSRALARLRQKGGPTFGLLHKNQFDFGRWWFARLEADAYLQVPDQGAEFAGSVKGLLGTRLTLSPKTALIPTYSLFARYLSVDRGDLGRNRKYFPLQVDQDVFTSYKFEHRAGSNLALELQHRPWLDTLWYVRGSVASNEDLNMFAPDHLGLDLGWSQLLGPVVADLGFRQRFFQADGDRAASSRRDQIILSLSWNLWTLNQHRLEAALGYTHDFSRDTDLGLFSLSWHGGEGRGLRDFSPGELVFPDLLQRDVPDERNHQGEPLSGF